MKPIRIGIHGAAGKMGRAVIQAVLENPRVKLGAAVDRSAVSGLEIVSRLAAVLAQFDVLVDFSRPEATLAALETCRRHDKPLVIGTTGFTPAQQKKIEAAAREVPVCQAANFSVGVNLSLRLLEMAAKALGDTVDVEIVEAHHRLKVDAPSGTALRMGETIAKSLGRKLEDCAVYARKGQTGARERRTIGFSTIRGGDVVGDHTVMFLGEGERLEITHRASSRLNFAQGAVRAAVWLKGRKPGYYGMDDVLGLTGRFSGWRGMR